MNPGCFGSIICHSPQTTRCAGCGHSDECATAARVAQKIVFGDNRAPIMNRFVAPQPMAIDESLPVHTKKRLMELCKDGLTEDVMRSELLEGRNPLNIKGKKPAFLYLAFELHLKTGFRKEAYRSILEMKGMSKASSRSAANTASHIINYLGV